MKVMVEGKLSHSIVSFMFFKLKTNKYESKCKETDTNVCYDTFGAPYLEMLHQQVGL